VHGAHPSLTDLQDGDLKHLIDYRQIYSTLLEQWLVADPTAILGQAFTTLPLIETPTGIDDRPAIPTTFYLEQNYPNPFNPATTIEYGIPRPAHVTLEIYNSLGQKIAVLVNERQSRGRHRVNWNANGHASGTYLFRIRAGDFEQSRRMTLVK